MKTDDAKDILKNMITSELGAKKATERNYIATLAGFSVCAGLLTAILQQLRSEESLTTEKCEEFYTSGCKEVFETYMHLLDTIYPEKG